MCFVIEVPPSYPAERRYVIEVLLGEFLGLQARIETTGRGDVRITVPDGAVSRELIVADGLFAVDREHWLRPGSLPREPLARWRNPGAELPGGAAGEPDLPVVFGCTTPSGGFLELSDTRAELGLDVFGSAFFFLTRYEEAVGPERDEHDRFPAAASLAVRERVLHRPVVNEYLEVLWSLLRWLAPEVVRGRRSYSVALSHDVDRPFYLHAKSWTAVARGAGFDLLRRGEARLAARKLVAKAAWSVGRRELDPCNTFDWIMDVSEARAIQSAFYFITGPSPERPGDRYSMDDPWIRRLLRRIHARGHEIGLHPGYATYLDVEQTRREFDKLLTVASEEGIGQPTWGGRQHYLRWSNPATWRNWAEVGLAYDSTLGFADQVGFRCGVCYEYPVFDLRQRTPLRLRERPLVVMDGSLLLYMGLSRDEALRAAVELGEVCRRYAGVFTLLWHNSSLMSNRERDLYRMIVEHVSRCGS